MGFTEYLPNVRDVHLIAVLFCLTVAALADLRATKMIRGALTEWDIKFLDKCHVLLCIGLAVLWGTGAILVAEVTGLEWANFSPKLMAKIAIVLILTVNARLIGTLALSSMDTYAKTRLGDMPPQRRMALCAMSSISTVSWIAATALGAIPVFKPMAADALTHIFGSAYGIGVLASLVIASLCGIVAHRLNTMPPILPRPPLTVEPLHELRARPSL